MVVIAPGSNLQVVIGILFALLFIRIYTAYRPFLDNNISVLKDLIQWQLFFVFFIALLLKTQTFPNHKTALHVLLVLTVFASLIADILNIAWWLLFATAESEGTADFVSEKSVWTTNDESGMELRPSDFSVSQHSPEGNRDSNVSETCDL